MGVSENGGPVELNWLRASNLSLRSIETETGISKRHLASFKNEKRNLSFQNLDDLAGYFKVRYIIKNF